MNKRKDGIYNHFTVNGLIRKLLEWLRRNKREREAVARNIRLPLLCRLMRYMLRWIGQNISGVRVGGVRLWGTPRWAALKTRSVITTRERNNNEERNNNKKRNNSKKATTASERDNRREREKQREALQQQDSVATARKPFYHNQLEE